MPCGHSHPGGGLCDHDESINPEGAYLYYTIDRDNIRSLNHATGKEGKQAIKPFSERENNEAFAASEEGDPELIIFIPFSFAVKLKHIIIRGDDDDNSPSRVKMWINREDIDFSTARDLPALQAIDLANTNVEISYPTQVSKFQNVHNITLFFPDNFGGDHTKLFYLGFKGEATNIKKGTVDFTYEAIPQLKDHKVDDGGIFKSSTLS